MRWHQLEMGRSYLRRCDADTAEPWTVVEKDGSALLRRLDGNAVRAYGLEPEDMWREVPPSHAPMAALLLAEEIRRLRAKLASAERALLGVLCGERAAAEVLADALHEAIARDVREYVSAASAAGVPTGAIAASIAASLPEPDGVPKTATNGTAGDGGGG